MSVVLQDALSFSLCKRGYGNHAAVALATVERNHTVGKGKKSMVFTHAYVLAGIVNRTALTHDDVTGHAVLATPNLNA